MDSIITALIGVIGTLAGILLGWLLNAQSYKIGKTKIYATFIHSTELPPLNLDGNNPIQQSDSKTEYIFECVASNSRQIPVILNNFHVEMKLDRRAKPTILSVVQPKIDYVEVNGLRIGAQTTLPRQLIPPHTLYEFSFKVDCYNPEIIYGRLVLVAYNEKHKCQRFLLYDGSKIKRPL